MALCAAVDVVSFQWPFAAGGLFWGGRPHRGGLGGGVTVGTQLVMVPLHVVLGSLSQAVGASLSSQGHLRHTGHGPQRMSSIQSPPSSAGSAPCVSPPSYTLVIETDYGTQREYSLLIVIVIRDWQQGWHQ